MKIYVVRAVCGDGGHFIDRAVIAYTSPTDAAVHIDKAQGREWLIRAGYRGLDWPAMCAYVESHPNEFDTKMGPSFGGTTYYHEEVELLESRA